MRIARAVAVGLCYFGIAWLLSGWGLPSPERTAYYPPRPPVRFARLGEEQYYYVTGPGKSFHPDEAGILGALASMRPANRDFSPHFFNYPSLHIYAVGAGLLLAQHWHWIPSSRDESFYRAHPDVTANLYRVGRCVSALWAALTLLALCLAADSGWLAAVLVGLAPLFLVCATSLTVDMAATCLATIAVLRAATLTKPARGAAFGTGILAGLAASAKYPAGLSLLPLLLVCLGPWERRNDRAGLVLAAVGGSALGFLLGTPYALLTPRAFLKGLTSEMNHGSSPHGFLFMDAGPAWQFHLQHTLLSGCGLPFTLCLIGIAGCLIQPDPRRRAMLLFLLAWVALLLKSHLLFARYAVPALPIAALLAVEGWGLLLGWMKQPGEFVARAGAVAFVCLQAGVALSYALVMTGPDTRMLAARQVASWPLHARVRLLEPPYFTTPPLNMDLLETTVGPVDSDTLRTFAPQYVVASEFELRDLIRLGRQFPGRSAMAKALSSPHDTLRVGAEAWVCSEVSRPAGLGPYVRSTRDEPQELLMLHPTIYLWRRI